MTWGCLHLIVLSLVGGGEATVRSDMIVGITTEAAAAGRAFECVEGRVHFGDGTWVNVCNAARATRHWRESAMDCRDNSRKR